ncbi:variant erythrocyte surface antigen-1 alpha subunit [Babesia bovis T2Bo]|uniref:Variant erythrocyte surface antigen-1, alpha subunit n=1 Tax=Babesia bovis TaxID=5865 RepID=A7ASR1_BABBO|nr:variant erythrocyte surface antigen-1 alpha subunit [Babesia bovis T2Bo]EDO05972.1 variant erythrocyte surface antigen-1 alpha subunit [Babesia bovis T2Bo]|eukprot:XP_001609540.1 variant erythrocyte surface antigen-1, alpha subunit [Babesia bovis T2Bo]
MAPASTFTPKASLTDAPTNLKEAIDWVLRVTGKDGKKNDECICGLAAAVTDLLQSVQLEYNGYQGDTKEVDTSKGASEQQVTDRLNGLFSLVQGLGGTAVVRTYIDQLAQVLSALVGWSEIVKCWGSGGDGSCKGGGTGNEHGQNGTCEYLEDVKPNKPCEQCKCMKWKVKNPNTDGTPLGRKCQRCSDSGDDDTCSCSPPGGGGCSPGKCKCALAGKCCKCCCKGRCGCKKECRCIEEDKDKVNDTYKRGHRIYNDSYQSAYGEMSFPYIGEEGYYLIKSVWTDLLERGGSMPPSQRRHHCAQTLLGSVCLIWSGITYMYWTGKYHKSSPRWNNHILDGSGLDDGTLSQWLQALGFPRDMLNNHGPGNRWDAIIWDGFMGKLYLGFPHTSDNAAHGSDHNDNTFRSPAGMNYAGYIHTVDRGAFDSDVFKENGKDINKNKLGAIFKLYILSCAYFTGLQKKNTTESTPRTPKTIREILYWLSALPYSPAYPEILQHSKEVMKKVAPDVGDKKQLSFYQTGRTAPITVHEFNLFAHFQAVTQYCPLVLIGIQGGLHSTKGTDKTTEPPIHSLYANTECHFTYPAVSIQAYNQVVHYIRALFYQLYFLRKQCAVKVALGGKWRECRYGDGVLGRDVVSWMCLGCDPMGHDRKCRVEKVKEGLGGVVNKLKALEGEAESTGGINGVKELREGIEKLRDILEAIGEVVVQLGNAQERLDRGNADLGGVMNALKKVEGVNNGTNDFKGVLQEVLGRLEKLVEALEKAGGLKDVKEKVKTALTAAKDVVGKQNGTDVDPCKNLVSAAIDGLQKALDALKEGVEKDIIEKQRRLLEAKKNLSHVFAVGVSVDEEYTALLNAINQLISICNSPKCPGCTKHSTKCGQKAESTICEKCLQPTTTGVPSPLQAFLEDRLPGFSCQNVVDQETENPDYPLAASHLGHCNGSGQCCPLPMGFRNQFYSGIRDCTGKRLYGILYFFSNENMMQSCVYTLVRVTAALSATTPQVLGDVFGFFRGGVGEKEQGKNKNGQDDTPCKHEGDPSQKKDEEYFCGWCASGLRDEVKKIEWVQSALGGKDYRTSVGKALIDIKGDKGSVSAPLSNPTTTTTTSLSTLTKDSEYLSPLTGELYTAVSATFGNTYLSWVLYLSDALHSGLESLSEAFRNIECRGCKGQCDPNKCKKGEHGQKSDAGSAGLCQCQSIVSCTGVLPVLYRHGFSYGNPFNLEGYEQKDGETEGDYSITQSRDTKHCHEFLDSLSAVIDKNKQATSQEQHPLTNLLSQVGKLQYDIRLPWIFVLTLAWLVAVLYLAFGAIWPLDWAHMRSHWLRGGEHQWQCMWYKVMTGRKGVELIEYFGRR